MERERERAGRKIEIDEDRGRQIDSYGEMERVAEVRSYKRKGMQYQWERKEILNIEIQKGSQINVTNKENKDIKKS